MLFSIETAFRSLLPPNCGQSEARQGQTSDKTNEQTKDNVAFSIGTR
jgi:hypothetical protein